MNDSNNFCDVCIQTISNPICPICFSREVKTWLRDKKIPHSKRIAVEKRINQLVNRMEDSPSDTECIICNSGKVNLCIYSLTAGIGRVIEKNIPKKIVKDFNEDFNTEIWYV